MNLLKELCSEEVEVVTLMVDNVSVIKLIKNPITYMGRSKLIEMRFYYLRELVSEGRLGFGYCKSDDQVGCFFFTKGVSVEVIKRLKKHMGMEVLEVLEHMN